MFAAHSTPCGYHVLTRPLAGYTATAIATAVATAAADT
jgi:hypothetical protein